MRAKLHSFLANGRLIQIVLIPWLLGIPTLCAALGAFVFARGLPLEGAWEWLRLIVLVIVTWLASFLIALVLALVACIVLVPLRQAQAPKSPSS